MKEQGFNPYHHFIFLTNRVGRLLAGYLRPRMVEEGYTMAPTCVGVLADLWSTDGVSQKDLGMSMIKSKSSINKLLETLKADGLIEKISDPQDKRLKKIHLTDKGKDLESIVVDASNEAEANLLTGLTEDEIATAKKVLTILYQNLSEQIQDHE